MVPKNNLYIKLYTSNKCTCITSTKKESAYDEQLKDTHFYA